MRKAAEFLTGFGAGRCGGEFRCGFFAIGITLIACCTGISPSARAEEPEQVAAQTEADESASRESVLVSFAFSAPDGVEDEIAKDHKLELVSKLGLPTLGLRVVRYAVPDARPIAAVIARLRADQRVSSAQVNVQYRQIEPAAPETMVGTLQKPPLPGPRMTAARKVMERRAASIFGDRRPARSARIAVGDVLAGGL